MVDKKIISCIILFCAMISISAAQTKDSLFLATGFYKISDKETGCERELASENEYYFIVPKKIIGAEHIKSVAYKMEQVNGIPNPILMMELDNAGTQLFSAMTGNAIAKKIAFMLNNKLIYASIVSAKVETGKISMAGGDYTKADLESFVLEIQKGRSLKK